MKKNSVAEPTVIDEEVTEDQEEEDAFLKFVNYARSVLSSDDSNDLDEIGPSWNWIVSRILKTCSAYSSGVTAAILLSDLSQVLFS